MNEDIADHQMQPDFGKNKTQTYGGPYISPIFVLDFVSEFFSNFFDDDRRLNVGELMIVEEKLYPFPFVIDCARSHITFGPLINDVNNIQHVTANCEKFLDIREGRERNMI